MSVILPIRPCFFISIYEKSFLGCELNFRSFHDDNVQKLYAEARPWHTLLTLVITEGLKPEHTALHFSCSFSSTSSLLQSLFNCSRSLAAFPKFSFCCFSSYILYQMKILSSPIYLHDNDTQDNVI